MQLLHKNIYSSASRPPKQVPELKNKWVAVRLRNMQISFPIFQHHFTKSGENIVWTCSHVEALQTFPVECWTIFRFQTLQCNSETICNKFQEYLGRMKKKFAKRRSRYFCTLHMIFQKDAITYVQKVFLILPLFEFNRLLKLLPNWT